MNPERWKQLKEIFEAALDKDVSDRDAFLEKACQADLSLHKEVKQLLESYGDGSFLEKPAYQEMPELFESESGSSLIGTQLGPYSITGKIGRGGMGIVYLARDTRLDRPVAIKMLAPKYTRDPRQRERLRREAKAAAKLSHPGIATVYSLEEYNETLYMVSEFVRGPSLVELIKNGPLPASRVLDIAAQIARALEAAHEAGIIHRDLKPENVACTESGVVKVLDFGLARYDFIHSEASELRLTHSGVFVGTPAYASPEQLLGSEVDFRTDIFSLGIIVYELATGIHPFGGSDSMTTIARILEGSVTDIAEVNAAIPKELSCIVQRCLNKKPDYRHGSARDLRMELEQLAAQDPFHRKGRADNPDRGRLRFLWWWQFHQACAGFGYYGMIYPLWRVKEWLGGVEGSLLFFPALVSVMIAANLRLHLWFTSSFYISELQEQRNKVKNWIRWADYLFVSMLAITAVRIHTLHAIIATLLMSVAIGSLVAFSLIEPTTTRAAFGNHRDN